VKLGTAFTYPFRGPHMWPNLGLGALCFLIPVVGPMVFMGYLIRAEILLLQNINADPPRFDFGRFVPYLTRGVQVFLVSLIASLVLLPIIWGAMFAMMMCMALLIEKHPIAAVCCILGVTLFVFLLSLLYGLVTAPMYLKAAFEDRFAAGFDFRFVGDYLKRVGLLSLGTQFLAFFLILPFTALFCIPIVGPYLALAPISFITAHIRVQLYLEYLARGGTPINIKYEPPDPAFPVIPANAGAVPPETSTSTL